MAAKLYQLTQGDKDIFDLARKTNNPNVITNYYLRSENSGTWFRHVPEAEVSILVLPESIERARNWQTNYLTIHEIWKHFNKPDYFGEIEGEWKALKADEFTIQSASIANVYRVRWEETGWPVFHRPHGFLFLPWQKEAHQDNSSLQIFPGGMGSGKTMMKAASFLVRGLLLPGYRALALAPRSIQAEEIQKIIQKLIQGTEFERRFKINMPKKPYPAIIFGHSGVGECRIECFPILDKSADLLTVTIDEALIDQAERLVNLEEVIKDVTTRMRGDYNGRPMRGQIAVLANSEDNPHLWDLYDESQDPKSEDIYGYMPGTFENIYVTPRQLHNFEKRAGKDEQSLDRFLRGKRPIGSGEHFPAESLKQCRSDMLDQLMTEAINRGDKGWLRLEAKRVDCYKWERPYNDKMRCIVAADPGWGNPPERNSAAIYVWDIINFPAAPAQLVAFHWVSGNGSPNPWMQVYQEYVDRYKAVGMNGFDSTGPQQGYQRLTDMSQLAPTPVLFGGSNKYTYLTLLKKLMADGKLQIPSLTHVFSQLSKYRLPDDKLRQDLVSGLFVTAALLEPYWQLNLDSDDTEKELYDYEDRYARSPYLDRNGALADNR